MSIKIDTKHPAELYVSGVLAGEIIASKWVRLACERHRRDLVEGHKRDLSFDRVAAQRVIDFFKFLKHSKGKWAGESFSLEPWQQFIVYCLFGWKQADGLRRFRFAHVEVARKNGKTTLWAGVGLYLFFADGEPGAEVYCAATKKDQAKILFSEAERMRSASPGLKKRITSFRNNMNIAGTASKFEPLGADEDTLDGLNPHGALVDELHAHKTRGMWDVLETAMGARRQPMMAAITTAGSDRETICWKQHEYGEKILERLNNDDSFFVYIACLDPGDDWEDEANWAKANPNLGVSVNADDLRARANKAKQMPSALNSFLRLRLNVWTNSETAAIKVDDWKACVGFSLKGKDAKSLRAEVEAQLAGRECIASVDLASTEDIACSAKLFPPIEDEGQYVFIPHFYIPEEKLQEKMLEWRAPYDVWAREGFLTATDGNVIDYDVIKAQILSDFETYDVRELTFDPWNATQFSNDLQKAGIAAEKLVKFPQTIAMFAEPTKALLEKLIPGRKLAHLGNPPLAWMASNLLVKEDNNGNKRPVKGKGRGKIDGIVALIMALGRAISTPGSATSIYETRGILTL
ncbi:MAG TPA: terminase TerL endonuclease subunit [Candidatus Acidoferrales bacterium]